MENTIRELLTSLRPLMLILAVIFFYLFLRNVGEALFKTEHDTIHKKRLKELNFDGSRIGQSPDEETKIFLNRVTAPFMQLMEPYMKKHSIEQLQKNLAFVGWSKHVDAPQFRVLCWIARFVGIVMFALLYKVQIIFAAIWCVILFFGPSFFLNNSAKNKKEKMFMEFPEFIRLTQGYLVAEMPLTDAVSNTIQYMSADWRPYLSNFVINSRMKSLNDALNALQEEVDIFEVGELLSLIRVSLDQGIDIQDSFNNQTEKVLSMQMENMIKKIEGRKMLAMIMQGPILLTIMAAFALPTVGAIMGM